MKSRLFTLASAVSSLLAIAATVLWVQSHSSYRLSCWSRPGGNLYFLQTAGDTIAFGVIGPWPCDEHRWNTTSSPLALTTVASSHEYPLGIQTIATSGSVAVDDTGRAIWLPVSTFANGRGMTPGVKELRFTGRTLLAPCSLAVTTTALLPTFWLATFLWKRLHAKGTHTPFCPTCHYNLTANTSGTCPECGSKITPTSAAMKK